MVIVEQTRRGQPKSRGRVFVSGCSRWSGDCGVKVSVRGRFYISANTGRRYFVVEHRETPEIRFAPDGRFSCGEGVCLRTSAAWDAAGR
jgi:hypothetical protein